MTTVVGVEYVNIDKITSELGARNTYQITSTRSLSDLYEQANQPSDLGIIKRLLAACRSASTRGNVTYAATQIGHLWREDNGPTTLTCMHMKITISSSGGVWSSRGYKMVTVVTITRDTYGVTSWWAGRGTALVTHRGCSTIFGGHVVGQLIGYLYFNKGLTRNMITNTLWDATAEPTPAWHSHARSQLAELAINGRDHDWHVDALKAIAQAPESDILTAVEQLIQRVEGGWSLLADRPDDWADTLSSLLDQYDKDHLASLVWDEFHP